MQNPPAKSKATPVAVQRIIGHIKGKYKGPTVVFFGGVHGNEPAGVVALQNILNDLERESKSLHGEFYGVAGNLQALKQGLRFIDEDLNRIWFPHRLEELRNEKDRNVEGHEMAAIYNLVHEILETATPPFYFIDLHTTSGETEPFIVVNDSLLNRKFTSSYPLPVILGIEEYLTGAMLSYINELGYVAFGYESGKHEDPVAVTNAEHFIRYTLGLTGFLPMDTTALEQAKGRLLGREQAAHRFYEIYHQHLIKKGSYFKMLPGFENFQIVPKGQAIAVNGEGTILTNKQRQLFMPLYQEKGKEGFYFIRGVPNIFLWMSRHLRTIKADALLTLLPGIRWASPVKEAILVDRRIARFFAKSLFHLLGYRTRQAGKKLFILKNRDRSSRTWEYERTVWLKKRPRS